MSSIAGGARAAPRLLAKAVADGAKLRAVTLLIFFGLYFFSLYKITLTTSSFHIGFNEQWPVLAIVPACLTVAIGLAFVFARFSFGYIAGFYLFMMMAGYFWLNRFSLLDYNHDQALAASAVSLVAFLLPALTIRGNVARPQLPDVVWNRLPDVILAVAAALLIWCAVHDGVRLVGLSEMDEYRAAIARPRLVQYAIGNTIGALIPFAIALALSRGRRWIVAWLCIVSLLYFPITLTKTAIFAAPFVLFMVVLSRRFEPRLAAILSLMIPLMIGLMAISPAKWQYLTDIQQKIFGVINFRMLAIPSISLDHYFEFFQHNPHTYFCQLSFLKPLITCPYSDQLGVVFANEYRLGNMNASLFATEGVASVGPIWMPLAALVCGFAFAVTNKLSEGLQPRFILISGAMIPITLMNVPLSTMLLSNGLALLMVLWWLTPRSSDAKESNRDAIERSAIRS